MSRNDPGLADLFVSHRSQLRRTALAIVGNPEWADDVMQDAYLKLVGAQLAPVVSQPLAYCYQVVRNMARDHHRRCAFEAGLLAQEEEGMHVASGVGTPEQAAMRRQNLVILEQALDTAPARTRAAFEMYFIRGMTQRDIGKTLKVSIGLVNSLVREATNLLLPHEHLLVREHGGACV